VIVGLAVLAAFAACTLSAAAGLGGSLLLLPILTVLFGVKTAITLSALMLSLNNLGKLVAYRHTLAVRAAWPLVACTILGSTVGATLLLRAPESLVQVLVALTVVTAFWSERVEGIVTSRRMGPLFAGAAGLLSGFAGTSGVLKGVALRTLALDRSHFVGAASLVSLTGDLTKSLILVPGMHLTADASTAALIGIALSPVAVALGRYLNRAMAERAFTRLFWTVMAGYTLRLIAVMR
jgi:uncharacterized protein